MSHHDLLIVGAGSGNIIVDDSFADWDVAIVEEGKFGGTCLNAGCIPSKMLSYTAETADRIRGSERFDIDAELTTVHWKQVRERVFGRLDPIAADGKAGREKSAFITVYPGTARFTGLRTMQVDLPDGPVEVEADRIVLAAGGRPVVPPPIRDAGLPYETSDTIMRIDAPPRRLAVLGGGYIAAELAEVFAAVGSEVTVIEQQSTLLAGQDETVAEEFTALAADRYDLRLGHALTAYERAPDGYQLTLDDDSTCTVDTVLVAAGRVPNTDRLDVHRCGIETHDDGRIRVDAAQRTTVDGVYALGDICTPVPLKHVANREATVVAHNLRHPADPATTSHELVPAAVFTQPQIATVGRTEQSCREDGLDYVSNIARYSEVAYGWAMEDETGFCKVIAERGTGRLLGAHLMGPQAPTLIQPLVLALAHGIDAPSLATGVYWIHPALTEVLENALLGLST